MDAPDMVWAAAAGEVTVLVAAVGFPSLKVTERLLPALPTVPQPAAAASPRTRAVEDLVEAMGLLVRTRGRCVARWAVSRWWGRQRSRRRNLLR